MKIQPESRWNGSGATPSSCSFDWKQNIFPGHCRQLFPRQPFKMMFMEKLVIWICFIFCRALAIPMTLLQPFSALVLWISLMMVMSSVNTDKPEENRYSCPVIQCSAPAVNGLPGRDGRDGPKGEKGDPGTELRAFSNTSFLTLPTVSLVLFYTSSTPSFVFFFFNISPFFLSH